MLAWIEYFIYIYIYSSLQLGRYIDIYIGLLSSKVIQKTAREYNFFNSHIMGKDHHSKTLQMKAAKLLMPECSKPQEHLHTEHS